LPNTRFLGQPTRSLEKLFSRTTVTPLRLFRVLWPVQRVEVEAGSVVSESYDLLDRFIIRAVADCGLTRQSDITDFLGVSDALVAGACAFLARIHHVSLVGDQVEITDLGRQSLATGKRIVRQKSRLFLLFDGVTAQPLPREYHRGDLTYEADSNGSGWTRLPAYAPFPLDHIDRLRSRWDRSDFNLPTDLEGLNIHTTKVVYTAAHLVETRANGILAYSEAAPDGDRIIQEVLRENDWIANLIRTAPSKEPAEIWENWRRNRPGGPVVRPRPNGTWRATYRAATIRSGELPSGRVGSFEYRDQHFIQIWCETEQIRQQALVARLAQMARAIRSREDLRQRIRELALVLELEDVSEDDVHGWGSRAGLGEEVSALLAMP
jgi:hypothetical protein